MPWQFGSRSRCSPGSLRGSKAGTPRGGEPIDYSTTRGRRKREMDQGEHRDELHEAEMQAIQKLGPDLKEHTELALGTFNLIGELLAHLPEEVFAARQQSLKVANGLLARLANDLRCVALLANRGYPIQGGILAATIYEIAFTIAYIGSDDRLAQEWIDREEPLTSFRDAWTLTRDGLRRLDL